MLLHYLCNNLKVAAQTGHHVVLVDINDKVLENSKSRIEKSVARVVKKKFNDSVSYQKHFNVFSFIN